MNREEERKKGAEALETLSLELPLMKPGNYCLKYDLSLREGAGLNYPRKNIRLEERLPDIHAGMRSNRAAPPGMLPKNRVVEILEIKNLSVSVWGRLEAGWICMYMSRSAYVKQL